MNQPIIQPSTDRQWMEYYQKKLKESEGQLRAILNLFRRDDTFVAKKGLHWAYIEVRDELTGRVASVESSESAPNGDEGELEAGQLFIRGGWIDAGDIRRIRGALGLPPIESIESPSPSVDPNPTVAKSATVQSAAAPVAVEVAESAAE